MPRLFCLSRSLARVRPPTPLPPVCPSHAPVSLPRGLDLVILSISTRFVPRREAPTTLPMRVGQRREEKSDRDRERKRWRKVGQRTFRKPARSKDFPHASRIPRISSSRLRSSSISRHRGSRREHVCTSAYASPCRSGGAETLRIGGDIKSEDGNRGKRSSRVTTFNECR